MVKLLATRGIYGLFIGSSTTLKLALGDGQAVPGLSVGQGALLSVYPVLRKEFDRTIEKRKSIPFLLIYSVI